MKQTSVFVALLCLIAFVACDEIFTATALQSLTRVSSPVVAPNGQTVIFNTRNWNKDTLKSATNFEMFMVNSSASHSFTFTNPVEGNTDYSPVFTPNSALILFLSTRTSDTVQLYSVPNSPGTHSSSDIIQVSNYPVEIDNLKISPTGDFILFTAEVYPDCDTLSCTAERDAKIASKGPNTGYLYDQLFVRHWDRWETGKRQHIFLQKIKIFQDRIVSLIDAPIDLMMGMQANCPIYSAGGAELFDISPEMGEEVAFSAEIFDKDVAWTTAWKTFIVSTSNPKSITCITRDYNARTQQPLYSPNGKYIAYLAHDRQGLEADRLHIVLYERSTQSVRNLTSDLDVSFDSLVWLPDSSGFLAESTIQAMKRILHVTLNGQVTELLSNGTNQDLTSVTSTGQVFFTRESLLYPAEIWQFTLTRAALNSKEEGGALVSISDLRKRTEYNFLKMLNYKMSTPEYHWFIGANNTKVQAWFLKPLNFDSSKTYPLAHLFHGGPQSVFQDSWSYRWNPQLFANHGYAVLMINVHGSTSFGQEFCDSVKLQWGGLPVEDLKLGLETFYSKYNWLDRSRACGLGASYGGYLTNWLNAKWSSEKVYQCLVTHDGVFDTVSSESATDELWSGEADFDGTPYDVPENYKQWNARDLVSQMTTPTLIIHGGKDYRLDITEGLSMFTALQRRGIPSRLLVFPMENHWVLNPSNSIMWYSEVFKWLDKWTLKQ